MSKTEEQGLVEVVSTRLIVEPAQIADDIQLQGVKELTIEK